MESGSFGLRDVDQHGVSELETPGGTNPCSLIHGFRAYVWSRIAASVPPLPPIPPAIVFVIVLATVDVLLNSRAKSRTPPSLAPPLPTQMRMMAVMLRTMTVMCFLHAGIPTVTVGSTTALMLFWP